MSQVCQNLIAGEWVDGQGEIRRSIRNPADQREVVADVIEASADQIDRACQAATEAARGWKAVPVPDRMRVLFQYREAILNDFDNLSRLIVRENGKLLGEARGSLRRGLDVVEFACGTPTLLMGKTLPEISRGIDCSVALEPVGVVAGIPPFNFPAMIPLWMMPVAVACGNAFILKPSEKAPLTATRLAELFTRSGLPTGVVQVVQGGQAASERLIADPRVQAVSFVGSTAVAKSVYRLAAGHGKRVQALGGAKNHLLVLPDADLERGIPAIVGACFGCAGQRCLAGSVLVVVGTPTDQEAFISAFVTAASRLKLGDGLDESATMGPVISDEHRRRILSAIHRGIDEGGRLLLDGRNPSVPSRPDGCFVGPTVFDHVDPGSFLAREEIFGPVVAILRTASLDEAIHLANQSEFGNSASLFSQSAAAAKVFRERIQAGMLGINVGVPAPAAFFSFGGWKQSLFGDLHAHGPDAVAFYTRKKVVTERVLSGDHSSSPEITLARGLEPGRPERLRER